LVGKVHVREEGRNGLIADRYEGVAGRSPTKLGGIIEGTRAVMENKVRTAGGQICMLPERWQIEHR
jgi:molybdopterin biosynthesis enzyme